MATDEARQPGETAAAFKSSMEDSVLTAFARGVNVEGSWEIDSPVADAPGWRITIAKVETEKECDYDASLIED